MKAKSFLISFLLTFFAVNNLNATYFVGGDISILPTFQAAGSKYYDNSGKAISDIVTHSYDQGMNAMRVRLFVDPDTFISELGSEAQNWQKRANQSYDYILPLCKQIKNAGHKLLLDFHYSDTWADPASQWLPKSWESLSAAERYDKIYEYTKEVLTNLAAEGCAPDFIQTGNEISYGMCWGAYSSQSKDYYVYISRDDSKRTYFQNLLTNAIRACREVCPEAKIVLHIERVPNTTYSTDFYDWAKNCGLDYDIIGLSYYFYYHGALTQLDKTLSALESKKYGKKIWIVETGAPYKYKMGGDYDSLYGVTDSEQNRFTTELLEVIEQHPSVNGVFWWDMIYNPYGANTSKYPFIQDWYNASIFDNSTGRALSSYTTLAAWAKKMNENASDDDWNNDDGSGEGNEDSDSNYYLLYNNNYKDWAVPGTKFNISEDGIYYLTDLSISGSSDGSTTGWFSITTTDSTSWDDINAHRVGPSTNDEDPSILVYSIAEVGKVNSWAVPGGVYDIYFDASEMTLTVKVSGTEDLLLEVARELEGHEGNVNGYEITLSAPVTENNSHAYVHVIKPTDSTALYYQVNNDETSEISRAAIAGYTLADEHSDGTKYIIPLVIGSQGSLNIFYETSALSTVPVAYSYTVLKKDSSSVGSFSSNEDELIIYNLQGVRVDTPKRGLYIVNGKKVMLR